MPSSKKDHVQAKSVASHSLTVDGPTNLKGKVTTQTINVTNPLFPSTNFPVVDSLLPVGPPGNLLSSSNINLSAGALTDIYTWSGIWTATPSQAAFNGTLDCIEMGAVLDQADYQFIQIGLNVSGLVTSSALAATRTVSVRLVDLATGTDVIGTNFPFQVPTAQTYHVSNMCMTDYITPTTWELDPARRWQIQFSCPTLVAAETIDFAGVEIGVFMTNAKLVAPV